MSLSVTNLSSDSRVAPTSFRHWEKSGSMAGCLDMELTERCNNNCIHCSINLPEDHSKTRHKELSTQKIKDILQQSQSLECLTVRFTGGEPLLREDFEELFLFARHLGMVVLIQTNARLITPRLADLFAEIPPRMPLAISVYGMRRDSYETVTRTPGSFAQFRRGVQLLLERDVPFTVKSVVLPQNRHEIEEFESWARTIPGMSGSPGYSIFLDLRSRRDSENKNRVIASLRPSAQEGLELLTRKADKYRRSMNDFAGRFGGPPGDVLFRCGAGRGVCIDAYGMAQPCLGIRAARLTYDVSGGMDETPLREAMKRFSSLSDLRATNPDYLRRCAKCFLKGLCTQCPAKSWAEHGTLDTPVGYLCRVAHAQARWLGWLGEDEQGWEVRDWKPRIGRRPVSHIHGD